MRYRRSSRGRGWLTAVVSVVVLLALFSAGRPADAQETFYDAYELGLAHERAKRWSAAAAAFKTAIERRPKAGRDVPTFGRDVLDVYDPYLHLARVEIELGQIEDAREHLGLARSAGVSPAGAIEALAGRLGQSRLLAASPTAAPATPAPKNTAPPKTAPPPATAGEIGSAAKAPIPTVDPRPIPNETTGSAHTQDADLPTAQPEKKGGGALLLLAVLAGVAVVVVMRRRRAKGSAQEAPNYDTTPTKRVETGKGKAAPAASQASTGDDAVLIGDYRMLDQLGRGGMATTYSAEHRVDGRIVVLKIPHEHLLDDAEFAERFLREGALGATIHHPNIIRIFEAGKHEGRPFIAMELVDGETLEARLARDGALPSPDALEIARGIALALDYAHVKGVVHRDIKPDNIMLLNDGSVKVMDFGIARVEAAPGLTATSTYLGTPLYSAPEAIDPSEVGPHSDLYSLGIVLYRMLSNRVPFEAPSPLKVVEMHRTAPLPPLSPELEVPAAVEAMVRRLTAKRADDRYPSAEAFLHDLNQYVSGTIS